jgi:hypothetical protein
MNMTSECEKFLAAVAEAGLWRSIDGRTVAVETDRGWYNLGTRIYLDHRPPSQVTRFPILPTSEKILVAQWIRPIDQLEDLVLELANGQATISDRQVIYRRIPREKETDGEIYDYHYDFSDITSQHVKQLSHFSAHALTAYGSIVHEILGRSPLDRTELDALLRSSAAPYDGFSDLEEFFLRKPVPTGVSTMVGMEMFAPFQLRFDRNSSRLEGGVLRTRIRSLSEDHIRSSQVAIFGMTTSGMPVQLVVDVRGIARSEDQEGWECDLEAGLENVPWAKALLNVGKWTVDRLLLNDPKAVARNPRVAIYSAIDRELEGFLEALFAVDAQESRRFEHAVARLFTFLGFQVDSFAGQRRLSEGVDLLAYDPFAAQVLAIECTVGSLDTAGKLGKLVARAGSIRLSVPECAVLPVIVSALSRDQLSGAEVAKAHQDGVAVISREKLVELVGAAKQGAHTEYAIAIVNLSR